MNTIKMKLLSHMAFKGINRKQMAEKLGWSEWKLRNRLNKPSDITLEDMNKMIKILDITEPKGIFYEI